MFERLIKPNQHKALLRIPIYFLPLLLLFSILMPSSAFAQASVCGYVFFDANQNGVKDDGELALANQAMLLSDTASMFGGNNAQTGTEQTNTDVDGKFCFTINIAVGRTYSVFMSDVPEDMKFLTTYEQYGASEPINLEVGQVPPVYVSIVHSSQKAIANFGFYGDIGDPVVWSQCQTDEEKDNSVCVHNNQYAMQVTPDSDAETKTPMQVDTVPHEQYGDIYVGDNTATEVFTGERGDNTRSTRNQENSEQFFITVGKNISATGEEEELEAFINPDDSISFIDPETPSLTLTLHEDSTFTAGC